MNKKIILVIVIFAVMEAGIVTLLVINRSNSAPSPTNVNQVVCSQYDIDNCPGDCTVCPPCPECSSISCQTEQFCQSMGIDDDWYDQIKDNLNSSPKKCAVETCHGLDVECGDGPPDFCTEIYMIGDVCLPYAECAVIKGQCQLVKGGQFDQCRTCVEGCEKQFVNDYDRLYACERECGS
jgi:hypothetical protein